MSKKQIERGRLNMGALSQCLSAIVGDIASAFAIPGGNIMGLAVQDLFKKRLALARDILLEEIRHGEKDVLDAGDIDEIAAIVYRYMRAAQEGAARVNLRLLAKVITGQNRSREIKADAFLYYADLISSLKVDEIKLMGIMVREKATTAYSARDALKTYFSEEKSEALFQSLLRTGLVIFYQEVAVEENDDWKSHDKFKSQLHTDYHLTSLMEEVCRLISWEEILDDESVNATRAA